jgi:hypothetical protein
VQAHELERLRRSVAMLRPGQMALRREDALAVMAELAETQDRLKTIRAELRRLAETLELSQLPKRESVPFRS